jgi:hypothetical protein
MSSFCLGDPVEDFTELIQRLLAIQSAGREKSLKTVAVDKRLIDSRQGKNRTGSSSAATKISQSALSDHSPLAQEWTFRRPPAAMHFQQPTEEVSKNG